VTDPVAAYNPQEDELLEAVPLDGMRGVIARSMTESLREMAQLTLHRRVEATKLLQFRNTFPSGGRPSVNDLVLVAVARTLVRHPAVNATLEDDTIFRWRSVHLGMAVAMEDGLVAPIIRNAQELGVAELHEEATRLGRLAREGDLKMPDLLGGTFTVSNLGAYGIDSFTPIVNPPQVAILGIGRISDGSMPFSLTIDHRALDGAPAAFFLQEVARVFADPSTYL
jgi:pyruvate dehydrogenase E2 component (dihydrolipoamide acetyltransferase)